jgi:hypothetical protein
MVRIRGASLVGVLSIVLLATACSATSAGGGGGGVRVSARSRPAADAVPTTAAAVPAGPTTALPNLPTVPTAPPPTAAPTTAAPTAFVPVEDDYGMLTIEVPATWTEIDTRPFVNDDDTLRPGISASTDLEAFDNEWDAPGLVYTAYRFQPDPNVLFGEYDYSSQCTDGGTVPYNDQVFVGYVRTFNQCSAARSTNFVIVANAPGNQVTIVLVVQTVTAADDAAYRHALETFNVDPNVSMPTETVPPDTTTTLLATAPLPTVPVPATPAPTAPVPTAATPTGPVPTIPAPTIPAPTSPPLPTSPLLTTPTTAPVVTTSTPTAPGPTTPGAANGVPPGYQEIGDDTGRLSVHVPSTWIDVDGASGIEEGASVAALSAAPNLTTFRETFDGPGLLVHETPFESDPAAELARRGLAGTCTAGPVTPNPNPAFAGVYQSWLDCGGTTTDFHVLVANPIDGRQVTVVMVVQTLTAADEEALKVAFASYRLNTTV